MVFNAGRFRAIRGWIGQPDQWPAAFGGRHKARSLPFIVWPWGGRALPWKIPADPGVPVLGRYGLLPPCFARATIVPDLSDGKPILLAAGTEHSRRTDGLRRRHPPTARRNARESSKAAGNRPAAGRGRRLARGVFGCPHLLRPRQDAPAIIKVVDEIFGAQVRLELIPPTCAAPICSSRLRGKPGSSDGARRERGGVRRHPDRRRPRWRGGGAGDGACRPARLHPGEGAPSPISHWRIDSAPSDAPGAGIRPRVAPRRIPHVPKYGAEFGLGNDAKTMCFNFADALLPGSVTFNVERQYFDRMLFDGADAGAEVFEDTAVKRIVRLDEGGVEVATADRNVHARVLLDCSGHGTVVGRHLGTRRGFDDPHLQKVAYFQHFENVAPARHGHRPPDDPHVPRRVVLADRSQPDQDERWVCDPPVVRQGDQVVPTGSSSGRWLDVRLRGIACARRRASHQRSAR